MIGIVVVREGRLGLGANEVIRAVDELWILGSGLGDVDVPATSNVRLFELGEFDARTWTQWIAGEVGERSLVLAASPDGRDLAGRLGERLGRPVHTGCLVVTSDRVVATRYGGATTVASTPTGPFVATIQPRSGPVATDTSHPVVERVSLDTESSVRTLRIDAPDIESVDLADASKIVAGGAGLADETDFATLAQVATSLGAAMGATRVISDRGWVPFRRQIGTTGATVAPVLYVAFGISGAVQHTSGLGTPDHIISVNTDASCPMSKLADVAIVSDATETLNALAELLGATNES